MMVLAVIGIILLVVAIWLGLDYLVMPGWNHVVHPVFHAPVLTFWQVFVCLFILGVIGGAFRQVVKNGKD